MAKSQAPIIGQMGLFRPESSWRAPTELPDLRGRPVVALDTETCDQGLAQNLGPGWALGLGYLAGVSYAAEGVQGYAPVRHPETECMPLHNVLLWLYDLVASGTRVVFHNGGYDAGWLGTAAGKPLPLREDQLEDTLAGSVMLDEDADGGYSLDACCAREGVPGKDLDLLTEAVRAYGGDYRRPSAELWRLPAKYAGPYAEADAVATLNLWRQLEPQLRAQGVWQAYRTEAELIPMIVAMRRRGVRLDVGLAQRTSAEFLATRDRYLVELGRKLGRRALTVEELRNKTVMERLFDAESITYPHTPATKRGSFSADWMKDHPHWLPKMIVTTLKFEEASRKFIDNYMLGFAHRGRLHAEVHQFRSDDGGTRTHRFSYSSPPLQQMSAPDNDPVDEHDRLIEDMAIGTKIRRCFLPEQGEMWAAPDFSSQEPRITVHFAHACRCPGVQPMVDAYIADPRMSYHAEVGAWLKRPKRQAKILNLAMTYGRGKKTTAEELGLTLEEGAAVVKEYHERLPYIKPLEDTCKKLASSRGYVRLIDGARIHFTRWEGAGYLEPDVHSAAIRAGKLMTPCSIEEARDRTTDPDHPWYQKRIVRAGTRKALNSLVQGSAARQTKLAMLAMWREGMTPLIQVHDEVGASVSSEKQVQRMETMMVEAVKLVVPVVVDAEVGPSWGQAKHTWAEACEKYGRPA